MSLWILWLATAWAGTELTTEDLAKVAQGEVVVRLSDDGTETVGAVDIKASKEQVVEALWDFDYRVKHASILRSADVYAKGDLSASVRFKAGILGFTGAWHQVYACEADYSKCNYGLDEGKDNSVESLSGEYVFTRVEGGVRVTHRSTGSPGPMYPTWLIRKANRSSTESMLESLRGRAQQEPQ